MKSKHLKILIAAASVILAACLILTICLALQKPAAQDTAADPTKQSQQPLPPEDMLPLDTSGGTIETKPAEVPGTQPSPLTPPDAPTATTPPSGGSTAPSGGSTATTAPSDEPTASTEPPATEAPTEEPTEGTLPPNMLPIG